MREEYDFSDAKANPFAGAIRASGIAVHESQTDGTIITRVIPQVRTDAAANPALIAILDSDIRAAFPTDEAVNLALRQVLNQTASSREPVAKK